MSVLPSRYETPARLQAGPEQDGRFQTRAEEFLRDLALILAAGAIGLAADSLQMWWGVFRYRNGMVVGWLAPSWDGVLWLQFATILPFCLAVAVSTVLAQLARGTGGWTLGVLCGRKVGGRYLPAATPAAFRPAGHGLVAGDAGPRRGLRSPDHRIWRRWSVPLAIANLAPRGTPGSAPGRLKWSPIHGLRQSRRAVANARIPAGSNVRICSARHGVQIVGQIKLPEDVQPAGAAYRGDVA